MVTGLQDGSLRAVCDGSYKPYLFKNDTSAAWVIENGDNLNAYRERWPLLALKQMLIVENC